MEKLNIAELLRDCPTDMELDCTICDNVYFDEVTPNRIKCFVKNDVYNTIYFHHDGTYITSQNAKCVIFPKGKTTWEGFKRPFKDGDIVVADDGVLTQMFILKDVKSHENDGYDGCCYFGWDFDDNQLFHEGIWGFDRLATEEEKEKLFKVINDNGYKWDPETKTLEKLIEPKFKVGDKIINKKGNIRLISKIMDDEYHFESGGFILFRDHDYWELVPNKFDITTLKPFESRVLVRSSMDGLWKPAVFGFRNGYNDNAFYIVGGSCWKQCIPYLNNEHLCGTTNDCDDYFKTWE